MCSDVAWTIVTVETVWLAIIYVNRLFAASAQIRRDTLPCGCYPDPCGFDCRHDTKGTR